MKPRIGRHPINVEVTLRDGESTEKMIRRFFKKCKKVEIIKEHLEKVSYARSKSRKRRDKIQKNKYLRHLEELKLQKKYGRR